MIILDGKMKKMVIFNELKEEVSKLNEKPKLTVIQIGDNHASNIYIEQKRKMAEYIGYDFNLLKLAENTSEDELINHVNKLNRDITVNGILIQLPLPKDINYKKVLNMIDPVKDVDGLTDINTGKLVHKKNGIYSCTPAGIIELLDEYNIDLVGLKTVVIGRSDLVGKPLANMLINRDATVTVCHSKTKDLDSYTKEADLLVVAVGQAKLIKENMVKKGAIVIDVGINYTEDGTCGDVDFEKVSKIASYITPVPGGVGQMTVAMLAKNVMKAYELQKDRKDL